MTKGDYRTMVIIPQIEYNDLLSFKAKYEPPQNMSLNFEKNVREIQNQLNSDSTLPNINQTISNTNQIGSNISQSDRPTVNHNKTVEDGERKMN